MRRKKTRLIFLISSTLLPQAAEGNMSSHLVKTSSIPDLTPSSSERPVETAGFILYTMPAKNGLQAVLWNIRSDKYCEIFCLHSPLNWRGVRWRRIPFWRTINVGVSRDALKMFCSFVHRHTKDFLQQFDTFLMNTRRWGIHLKTKTWKPMFVCKAAQLSTKGKHYSTILTITMPTTCIDLNTKTNLKWAGSLYLCCPQNTKLTLTQKLALALKWGKKLWSINCLQRTLNQIYSSGLIPSPFPIPQPLSTIPYPQSPKIFPSIHC